MRLSPKDLLTLDSFTSAMEYLSAGAQEPPDAPIPAMALQGFEYTFNKCSYTTEHLNGCEPQQPVNLLEI